MKHFDYFAPTEIIFGAGRVTEAGALAARYGKKAMLVTCLLYTSPSPRD